MPAAVLLAFLAGCRENVPLPTMSLSTAIEESNLQEIKANLHHNRGQINEEVGLHGTPMDHALAGPLMRGMPQNVQTVSMLLDYGADPNKGLPLARTEQVEIAKLLLDRGADPNHQVDVGQTPADVLTNQALAMARGADNLEVILLTLDRGADPSKCRTGLALGLVRDRGLFEMLLKSGMPVRWKDQNGQVKFPESRSDPEEQLMLLQRMFDTASEEVKAKGFECFRVFRDEPPVDISHLALREPEVVILALKAGARPTGDSGRILEDALKSANVELVEALVKAGYFNPSINPDGMSLARAIEMVEVRLNPPPDRWGSSNPSYRHWGSGWGSTGSDRTVEGRAILALLKSQSTEQ